jgi:hypothetical protein
MSIVIIALLIGEDQINIAEMLTIFFNKDMRSNGTRTDKVLGETLGVLEPSINAKG